MMHDEETRPRMTMIGNSHIDPVWLWREGEGLQEVRATFASALARMDEFDEFVFSASSAALYAWMEEHHPQLFAQIQARVAEGRWQIVGGWWIEPDCNIPGGESLVRQGLYAQRYFQRAFGRMARTAFNVDSFGHSAGIPRILRGQGIQRYVCMRPNPEQMTLPASVFSWQDADGSAVTACQIQGEYCAWTKTAIVDNLDRSLRAMEAEGLGGFPVFYGVGNHGGGPTIENIKAIRELAAERPGLSLENGGPDAFFDRVDTASLPAYEGELEGVFPGCYTADSQLKRLCRRAEEALAQAETMAVLAMPQGYAYPQDALTEAWKLLLFSQFHDTMAGTARKEARDEAVEDLHRCLSIAREVTGGALQALAASIDTRGDGHALVLVNATDSAFDGIVDADLQWRDKFPLRLKGPDGYEVAYDYSRRDLVAPSARKHLVFRAQVPAFGYAVYRLMPETALVEKTPMKATENVLENDRLRLTFDPKTGALSSLQDKVSGEELLRAPLTLEVYEDARDTWGGQGEIGAGRGQYVLEDMFLLEAGAVRSTMCVRLRHQHSQVTLQYSLGAGDAFFTLEGTLDGRDLHAMTALRLPFAQDYDRIQAEMPYAEMERPYVLPGEHHCQRYTNLVGDGCGLLLINHAKYGYRVHEGAYEVLLSRTPIHAFSSGEVPEPGRLYPYVDQDPVAFSLRVLPHAGDMARADRIRAAQRLHRPPLVLAADLHDGPLALRAAPLAGAAGTPEYVTHLLKAGEDGGIIARVESLVAHPVEAMVAFDGRTHAITLPPLSLCTLHLDSRGITHLTLLEESCES